MTSIQALHLYATQSDPNAFTQLVATYQHMVYAACHRRLDNPADVEDAVQETFIKLAKHAATVQNDPAGWLYRTASNTAINLGRKATTRQRHEKSQAQQAPSQPAEQDALELAQWQELRSILDDAIASLDADSQKTIIDRFLMGRTQHEMAIEAGISQPGIKRRIDRAVEKLRQTLAHRGVTTAAAGLTTTLLTQAANAQAPASLGANLTKIGLAGVANPAAPAAGLSTATNLAGTQASLGASVAASKGLGLAAAAVIVFAATVGGILLASSGKQPSTPPVMGAATTVGGVALSPEDARTHQRITQAIKRFVNQNTVYILHANLTRFDPSEAIRMIYNASHYDLGNTEQQQRIANALEASVARQIETGGEWYDQFRAAGGEHVLWVGQYDPAANLSNDAMILLAKPKADGALLAGVMGVAYVQGEENFAFEKGSQNEEKNASGQETKPGPLLLDLGGGVLLGGPPRSIAAILGREPAKHEAFERHLGSGITADAQLIFVPNPALRDMLQNNSAAISSELGNGSVSPIGEALAWASVHVDLQSDELMSVTAKALTADHEPALMEMIKQFRKITKKDRKGIRPRGGPEQFLFMLQGMEFRSHDGLLKGTLNHDGLMKAAEAAIAQTYLFYGSQE